jgi:hypothetical protein
MIGYADKPHLNERQIEYPVSIKVGHDRYQNLIIKELKIAGDDINEVFRLLTQALTQFEAKKLDQ